MKITRHDKIYIPKKTKNSQNAKNEQKKGNLLRDHIFMTSTEKEQTYCSFAEVMGSQEIGLLFMDVINECPLS